MSPKAATGEGLFYRELTAETTFLKAAQTTRSLTSMASSVVREKTLPPRAWRRLAWCIQRDASSEPGFRRNPPTSSPLSPPRIGPAHPLQHHHPLVLYLVVPEPIRRSVGGGHDPLNADMPDPSRTGFLAARDLAMASTGNIAQKRPTTSAVPVNHRTTGCSFPGPQTRCRCCSTPTTTRTALR